MTDYYRPADATMRALTWNVGRLLPHPKLHKTAAQRLLQKRRAGLSAYAHDRHLSHIASVIRHLDPDIVTLQEIGSRPQLERLLDELGLPYRAFLSDDAEMYDRHVAILTRNDLFASLHPIRTTSGRIALAAHAPGYDLVFVGLHVDAIRYKRRTAQITEIMRWLERHLDQRVIIAGDFNLDLHAVGPRIRRANLEAYKTITEQYRFSDMAAMHGNTTSYLPRRLDYVFSNIGPYHVLGSRVLRGTRKGMMDHHPIVADFRFD